MEEENSRIITEAEIYHKEFFILHEACLNMAIREAKNASEIHHLPIEVFDISALTFQHYKMFLDRREYLRAKAKEEQEKLDKKFK